MKRFVKVYFEVLYLIGLIMMILVSFDTSTHFLSPFIRGLFSGFSIVCLIVAGLVKFSPKIQEKLSFRMNDERIKTLNEKASNVALYALFFLSALCIIVFGLMGQDYLLVSLVLASLMFLVLMVLFITKLILAKRM